MPGPFGLPTEWRYFAHLTLLRPYLRAPPPLSRLFFRIVIVLVVLSLAIMHAFVYAVGFRGQASVPEETSRWSLFLRYTVPGYAIALLASLYLQWTFGRMDGAGLEHLVMATVVLAFPAAIGAAMVACHHATSSSPTP